MSAAELSAELPAGGHVLFTDRSHGNVSSVGGTGCEKGESARARLREQIGLASLARVHQVHGTTVRLAEDGCSERLDQQQLPHADAQLTTVTGLGLMVLAADCLPVALGRQGAVAMIHAGWRGLAAGILERTVQAISEIADRANPSSSSKTVAVIGPGAGACCYEVGPEVHAAFGSTMGGYARIDLPAIARRRLLAAGVDRVERLGGCTICDERYFSHRREGKAAGRMAGVAWLS